MPATFACLILISIASGVSPLIGEEFATLQQKVVELDEISEEVYFAHRYNPILQQPRINVLIKALINTSTCGDVLSEECLSDMLHFTATVTRLNLNDPFLPTSICGLNLSGIVGISSNAAQNQVDANSKIPPGILSGNIRWRGSASQCLSISEAIPQRHRLYETGYLRVPEALTNGTTIQGFSSSVLGSTPFLFTHDMCLPKSCANKADALFLLRDLAQLPVIDTPTRFIRFYEPEKNVLKWPGVVVIVILCFFLVVSLSATVIDYVWYQDHKDSHFAIDLRTKIFLSYSFYTNVREIFQAKNRPGQIGAIQCIRCFSIVWVLCGHTFTLVAQVGDNTPYVVTIVQDTLTMVVSNASFAVDSFFFMSGLLLGFMWFKDLKRNRRFTMSPGAWMMFYVHRVIRLSPPYYMVIAAYTWVIPYFLNRSVSFFSIDMLREKEPCQTQWWSNLLYINNIYKVKTQCYPASWYLATDFQIYIFAPIILLAFAMKPLIGWIISAALIVASLVANAVTIYHFHMPPFNLAPLLGGAQDPKFANEDFYKYTLWIYGAAWIRFPVYVMGIMLGYFLQFNTKKIQIPWWINLPCWGLCFTGLLGCIFGVHSWTTNNLWPLFWRAFYSALSKPVWAACLSWIVFASYYGYGGFIDKFMSWNIWMPLGKLTYCTYLLHPMLLFIVAGVTDYQLHFAGILELFVGYCIALAVVSFTVAIFWSSTFEIATGKVEMLLLGARRGRGPAAEKRAEGEAPPPQLQVPQEANRARSDSISVRKRLETWSK